MKWCTNGTNARWRVGVGLWLFAASLLPTLGSTVDDVVTAEMQNHGIVGVSIAIIVDGKICTAKGYGFTDKSSVTRVTTNTLFQAGSVSKPVAALAACTYEQPLPPDRATLAATGYYPNGSEVKNKWHVYPEMAAAGLWTTPSDLARFAIKIQEALAAKSNPMISSSMARQMLTVQKDNAGLGLFLSGSGKTLRFDHGGRDEGFDTLLMAYAESGHGVVIMINANDNSGAVNRMVDAVRKEYHWPEPL